MLLGMEYVFIGVLGLLFGSFVNALVWRVYLKDKAASTKNNKGKKLPKASIVNGRSMCPNCKHVLRASDLVPVLSWVFLGGKCRYCKKPISVQYPFVEILTSCLFVVTYIFWPFTLLSPADYFSFSLFYFLLTLGVALSVYDLKWMILPTHLVYVFNAFSAIYLILSAFSQQSWQVLVNGIIGALLFSGFFYLLYQFSKGKWIGGGDVRLAVGLGLILGWQKSIFALTIAAYLGTLVIFMVFLAGRYHKKMKLPFGPFLLAATLLTVLWGQTVIDWYLQLSGL